jgi:hypothetical protein
VEVGARKGAYAGAVAVVTCRGHVALRRATGWAVHEPEPISTNEEPIFDLASLTKVIATLPSDGRLVDVGTLNLNSPSARY